MLKYLKHGAQPVKQPWIKIVLNDIYNFVVDIILFKII